MSVLTHYIVVRRDLALGTTLAMVAHAAGESFLKLDGQDIRPRAYEDYDPAQTIAIVKGARNAGRLVKLAQRLTDERVLHVVITETEGPYAGEVMAIGVCPVAAAGGRLAYVRGLLNDFQQYPEPGR